MSKISAISLSAFLLGKRTFKGAVWVNVRRNGTIFLEVCDEVNYCIGDLQLSAEHRQFLNDVAVYELLEKNLP